MPRIKSKRSDDPEFHRRMLRELTDNLDEDYGAKAKENYTNFLQKLFGIFQDNPPKSWRFISTTYDYPAFRVFNKATGRINDFLRVTPWRLIISHRFFDERFRHLFPVRRDFYGQGDGRVMDFETFSEEEQNQYVDAIRLILQERKQCSINFSAVD